MLSIPRPPPPKEIAMGNYTPEQVERQAKKELARGKYAETYGMLRAYAAALRQQAERVDDGGGGLCQRNPAPNAAQPMGATSPTVRLEAALSAQPAPLPSHIPPH